MFVERLDVCSLISWRTHPEAGGGGGGGGEEGEGKDSSAREDVRHRQAVTDENCNMCTKCVRFWFLHCCCCFLPYPSLLFLFCVRGCHSCLHHGFRGLGWSFLFFSLHDIGSIRLFFFWLSKPGKEEQSLSVQSKYICLQMMLIVYSVHDWCCFFLLLCRYPCGASYGPQIRVSFQLMELQNQIQGTLFVEPLCMPAEFGCVHTMHLSSSSSFLQMYVVCTNQWVKCCKTWRSRGRRFNSGMMMMLFVRVLWRKQWTILQQYGDVV